MGAKEKYVAKYNREPTPEELAKFKAERAAKKEKKAKAAEAEAPPAEPSHAIVAVPSSAQAGEKRSRQAAAPFVKLSNTLAKMSKAAASLAQLESPPDLDLFREAWEDSRDAAEELFTAAEKAVQELPDETLSESSREALVAHFRALLEDARKEADEFLPKQPKRRASGKRQRTSEGSARVRGSGGGRKGAGLKVKQEVLDSALAKLENFKFDLFDAVAKGGDQGLSTAEIKQLAIYKSVYDSSQEKEKGAKIKMIKALMLNKSFEDEKRAAGWGSE